MRLLGNLAFIFEIFFCFLILNILIGWNNSSLLRLFIPTLLITWWVWLINILFSVTHLCWKISKLTFFIFFNILFYRLLLNWAIISNTSLAFQRVISLRFQSIGCLISIVNIWPTFQTCFQPICVLQLALIELVYHLSL